MKYLFKELRRYLTGLDEQYVLRKCGQPVYENIRRTGLYVHIPYCKNLCPYCPYNKIAFECSSALRYNRALKKEIGMVSDKTGNIPISSIYYGGGTPTLCMDTLLRD